VSRSRSALRSLLGCHLKRCHTNIIFNCSNCSKVNVWKREFYAMLVENNWISARYSSPGAIHKYLSSLHLIVCCWAYRLSSMSITSLHAFIYNTPVSSSSSSSSSSLHSWARKESTLIFYNLYSGKFFKCRSQALTTPFLTNPLR